MLLVGYETEHAQHHPCGNHVADVTKDDKDVEDGMYVGDFLEAVEYCAYDVGHTFSHYP